MPAFLRRHAWRLSIALLSVGVLTASFLFLRNSTSEAFPGMPSDQRAYWEWVSTINRDKSTALESGFALLEQHPQLRRVYSRIAEVCLELERVDECRTSLELLSPDDALSSLYRQAALALISENDSTWTEIASADALDPALARVIVDRARRNLESGLLEETEASWSTALAADSSLAGAAFGLGYAAVLRNDWDRAKPLLTHVTNLLPDDPQAYREFGRIYYFTGDYDGFTAALEKGIESARRSYDLEQELVLRGNLGLGYLQWKGDIAKAGEMFEAALYQSRLLSMRDAEGFNLNRLANVRGREYRYQEALSLLDSAEVRYAQYMPQRIIEVHALRGTVLTEMLRHKDAEEVLEKTLALADSMGNVVTRITTLLGLVNVKGQLGLYAEAQKKGLEALELTSSMGMADFEIASRIALGSVERKLGNYEVSEQHLLSGLKLAEETRNEARVREVRQQLGITLLQSGDVSRAHEHFNAWYSLVKSGGDQSELANVLYWIGNTFGEYENYGEALKYFERALQTIPGTDSSSLRHEILRSQAGTHILTDQGDTAIQLLTSIRDEISNNEEKYIIDVLLGHALVRNGDFDKAIEYFNLAEQIEDELQWSAGHWYALYGEALAYWGLGDRIRAEAAFREAIAIIEAVRDNINRPENRAYFVHDKVAVYQSYSAFLEEANRNTEAFSVSERVRSRTLVDLLYTTQFAGASERHDVAGRAIELNQHVQILEGELLTELVQPAMTAISDRYRSNRAAYLRRERERADSLYKSLQTGLFGTDRIYTFNPIDVDSVQAILNPGEALVAFNLRSSIGRRDGKSSAHVILKDQVKLVPLSTSGEELIEKIRFFRAAVSSAELSADFKTLASRLYNELMAPVVLTLPPAIKHLHIVPQGILHYLPFAALMDGKGRYLVESYSLSVTPSATILKLSRDRNPRRWSYILLLADPDNRLPGARREVFSIAAAASSRRHALVGKEASEETLEKVAANYDILHFATHGNFVSRAPWNSHLELYGDRLSVEEIGRLNLDAYLVTLSACETALASGLTADIPNGDEWVGLNQAFLAAGTPTVMASLWPIDDSVSSQFMVSFYDKLGAPGKAVALAEIQRQFLKDPKTANPFFWAAFTVIGDPL